MQTSKKDNNIYVKVPDKMESYFLNILKRYFDNNENNIQVCAESIIVEAVKRAKKEILFKVENSNVLSVNNKTGDVVISLEDLSGEPRIFKKYSAFNKPFGDKEDTVCEGDDPRLSDARNPKPHDHDNIYIRKLKVDVATTTENGFMSWEDKIKLNRLENYTHPDKAGFKHIPAGGNIGNVLINIANGEAEWYNLELPKIVTYNKDGLMMSSDKIKLDNISENANNYTHPDKHSPNIIEQDKNNRFVTDLEKESWNSKADVDIASVQNNGLMSIEMYRKLNAIDENANNYTHPSESGYRHIPAGGSLGNILTWKGDGKAEWAKLEEKKVDWSDIENKPAVKENPTGNNGQTYFIGEDSSNILRPSYLLYKANIINTEAELNAQKAKKISFADVFNNWKRFSHNGDIQPANPSEMQSWSYSSSSDSIVCTINSASYIGFISNDKYNKYIHEVTIKSTDSDDDRIGVVIAYAVDSNGKEHTISALRHTESQPYWFLVYDYMQPTAEIIDKINIVSGDERKGWSSFPNGAKIKVERNGDIINVYTSPFNSTTIDISTKLSLNLTSNSKYSIFRGLCSYGYACQSQNSSTFSDITFSEGFDNIIYDVLNNKVWKYNNGWVVDNTKSIATDIGIGRFVLNENTGKLFYINTSQDVSLCNQVGFDYGTTSQRPRSPKMVIQYFDTTINKLIVWNGSLWIDAMGTIV